MAMTQAMCNLTSTCIQILGTSNTLNISMQLKLHFKDLDVRIVNIQVQVAMLEVHIYSRSSISSRSGQAEGVGAVHPGEEKAPG